MCYLLGEVTDLFPSLLPSLHRHHRQSYPPAPLPYLGQKGQLAGAQEARLLHHPLILCRGCEGLSRTHPPSLCVIDLTNQFDC